MKITLLISGLLIVLAIIFRWLVYYNTPKKVNLYKFLNGKLSPLPSLGDRIEITWLPNPRNHPKVKNCHIGSRGTVSYVDPNGDGFTLRYDSGGSLLILSKEFQYVKLEDEPAYEYDI